MVFGRDKDHEQSASGKGGRHPDSTNPLPSPTPPSTTTPPIVTTPPSTSPPSTTPTPTPPTPEEPEQQIPLNVEGTILDPRVQAEAQQDAVTLASLDARVKKIEDYLSCKDPNF